ncbi:MAG: PQQ-dependent sugar dehydrogenase [Polyangiaceae bacterium]|nr:PQQ-dependent sugar dehydrogenase [Polyangiaceae bacterium]
MSASLRFVAVSAITLAAFVACGSDGDGGGSSGTGGSATGGKGGTGGSGGSTSGGGTAGSGGGTAGSGGATGGTGGATGGTGGATGGTGGATGGTGGTGGATGGTGGATGGTGGTGGSTCGNTPPALKLTNVGTSIGGSAVFMTSPPGDTARLFVVRQSGVIRIIKSGTLVTTPFLDITSSVSSGGERGLLGLAFHPQYATNGRFFVYYTQSASPTGDIVIAEYKVSTGNPDVAATAQVQKLVQIGHSVNGNHNGGMLAFGPDGYLYAGIGDGGGGGDPFKAGQDLSTNLGKILRLNPDNPTQSVPGNQQGLIWDWGLRNPWRFSFDRTAGDLYIADVGQNAWEEIDFEPKGSGKKNYGWSIMEGNHCYGSGTCNQTGLVKPVHEYSHSAGCSITGGYVYRGNAIPCLKGWYLYGDYCTGTMWGLRVVGGVAQNNTALNITQGNLSSFGEDQNGELYVTSGGQLKRIDAQ